MSPVSPSLGDSPESFRLHYLKGARRCVVSYDTLEAALEGALRVMEKDDRAEPWISDQAKRTLMDTRQIRARLNPSEGERPAGPG
jgi:hypothetical protein